MLALETGAGKSGLDYGPFGGDHLHRFKGPSGGGQVRINGRLEGVVGTGQGHGPGAVDRAPGLGGRTAEVDDDLFILDAHFGLDRQQIVDDAVAFQEVLEGVLPPGQLGDAGQHPFLRVVDQALHVKDGLLRPVFADDLGEAVLAHVVGRQLGLEIALGFLAGADVGCDQGHYLLIHHPGLHDPDGRNPDPLLEDLGGDGRHAPRGDAPDVHMMGQVGQDAQALPFMEQGRDDADVGQMGAADVGVVGDDGIAGVEGLHRENLQGGFDHRRHQPQVEGDMLGLGHQFSFSRIDPGGAVPAVLDVGRKGGPDQGRTHLLGHGLKGVAHHFQSNRVGLHHFRLPSGPFFSVMIMLPPDSIYAS